MKFVHFDNMNVLCRVNPCIRLKNSGTEVIEGLRVEVEEKYVKPVGLPEQIVIPNKLHPTGFGLHVFHPIINLTQEDDAKLSEKIVPGNEAIIPLWRPLIRAMTIAQKKVKSNGGQYLGGFEIRVYSKGVGATSFDRADGYISLGFTWSAAGFRVKVQKAE
jgi:hypothetical protein